MRGLGPFLKDAWRLDPSVLHDRSDEKWAARGMLLAIVAMNLTLVGLSVVLSFWRREFYNALQDKDWKAFLELLFLYRNTPSGLLPGFCGVAVVYIALYVYSVYVNQLLQIRWRRWMTGQFLHEWLADRAYYHISLTVDRAAIGTDNPDQRVAEDLRDFTRHDTVPQPRPVIEPGLDVQLHRHSVGPVRRHRRSSAFRSPATWSGSRWPMPPSAPG